MIFKLEPRAQAFSKTFVKRITTLGLLASLVIPALHAAEARIWTSRKGTSLEAELIRFDDKNEKSKTVTLLNTKDRKEMVLPMVELSIADREFLVETAGADPKILIEGEAGQPEKQVKIETNTFKKLKPSPLLFDTDSESDYDILESEHFIIATAGEPRPQPIAETAERMWHGMAFQHMNFRRDWGDKKMVIMVVGKADVYTRLGKWYMAQLKKAGKDDDAARLAALWERVSGAGVELTPEMTEKMNCFPDAPVFNVKPDQAHLFKKEMGPFIVHCIADTLLDRQMGNIASYGVKGLFAVSKGHAYYKEISLTGKSETAMVSASGSDNSFVKENKGYGEASEWAKTLKSEVKKGTTKLSLGTMFGWDNDSLKPNQLAVMYSFSYYMQSTPARQAGYAALIRRIESSKQIPVPDEIASIFGFPNAAAFEADWKLFVTEGPFK